MVTSIDLSLLRAIKSPLEHDCKHVLRWLRLYGDQPLHKEAFCMNGKIEIEAGKHCGKLTYNLRA